MDCDKAFHTIHPMSFWHVLREYGMPQDIDIIVKSFGNTFACKVGSSKTIFNVMTDVSQGYGVLALLFNLAIECVMRRTTKNQSRGIRLTIFHSTMTWALQTVLHCSHTLTNACRKGRPMSAPMHSVWTYGSVRGRNHQQEVDRSDDSECVEPITCHNELVLSQATEEFTYLGRTVRYYGWLGIDTKNCLVKARNPLRALKMNANHPGIAPMPIYDCARSVWFLPSCTAWSDGG